LAVGKPPEAGALFDKLYGGIQASLYNQQLTSEEKILSLYVQAYEQIKADLAGVYASYAQDGKLSFSEMSKYNRLKNLESQVSSHLKTILKRKDNLLIDTTKKLFEESFYQHSYAIDQNGGCALKWGLLRDEDVEALALSPLGKLSESRYLQGDRDQAVYAIRKLITIGIVKGDDYPKMARSIRDAMGIAKLHSGKYVPSNKGQLYKALRIARTEGQRAAVEGQRKAYETAKEEGVELKEIWDAALDSRTRPEHGALDGKEKKDKGWKVPSIGWVTAPLQSGVASFDIHCRCRIRGQIKGYPPKVRGVKGEGQQPWVDYESWRGAVQTKGSAKSLNLPPPVSSLPVGEAGAKAFGARLTQKKGSHPGGSTGAKLFVDDEGSEWIVKKYHGSKERVRNEFVGNQIYDKVGVQVASSRLAYIGDDLAIATKHLGTGYKTVGYNGLEMASAASRVKSGFVTDAWLANWDVAGASIDNLMISGGKISTITRIDQGGTLFYRAQGAKKGSAFGSKVTELKTLRDPSMNHASAGLFKHVTDADIAKQIRTLKIRIKKGDITEILKASGLSPAEQKNYYKMLTERLDYLYKWEKDFKSKPASKIKPAAPQGPLIGRTSQEVTKLTHESWNSFTSSERQAIANYTGSGYRGINRDALEGIAYRELDQALDKLPYYEGVVGRGVSNIPGIEKQWKKWKSGDWAYVQWKAYSSTSITPGRNFGTDRGYLAVIKTKGKNRAGYINGKSNFASEDEYLFGMDAKFRVAGYAESPDGRKRTILLEEVDDIADKQEPPKKMEYEEILKIWKESRGR
jgi:hypothetical protein